ncbi:MAG: hypothetical protein R3A45_00200 [Bdellovibrionota bacterium]
MTWSLLVQNNRWQKDWPVYVLNITLMYLVLPNLAAQLEASKIFAKNIMLEAGIPTANSQSFTNLSSINDYLKQASYPLVIKADGLAAGKGVAYAKLRLPLWTLPKQHL